MLFQSVEFIVFLLIIWVCYWKMPPRYRWVLMLAAGCFYYSLWNIKYIALILVVAAFSYMAARCMENKQERCRKVILIADIVFELAVLFVFKYLGFFGEICNDILSLFGNSAQISVFQLVLPVGISFYIFQTLAYVIDVYTGKILPEKHIGCFLESVIFFPILLAGPIERIQRLTAQFREEKVFSYENACMALQRILLGYMKKMIIADSLAAVIDRIYGDMETYRGFPLLLAILFYSVQIYCDFSGYSDIAIGVAGLFGIHIQPNFRQPYFADSLKDFWKRWHISLTSWFREYIYIPLGGSRVSDWKIYRNVMCVYLLSGLWHGAAWTFLIWGGLNGALQVVESVFRKNVHIHSFPKIGRQIVTFVLVSIMWVFFRMDSLADAVFVLRHCLDGVGAFGAYITGGIQLLELPKMQVCLLGIFLLLLFFFDRMQEKGKEKIFHGYQVSIVFMIAMLYYCKYGIDSGTFIYFQF
ncbi:MAG: MBOAT family protein [Clostridium sp.]|nr:MBOAT family protein [Clostridium sp.]